MAILRDASGPGYGLRWMRAWLPQGNSLGQEEWARRHRALVAVAWAHVVAVVAYGIARRDVRLGHVAFEAALVGAPAALAASSRGGRQWRSAASCVSLLTASSVLVHLSGGRVEAHFHFFVVIALAALYQDWLPHLLALGYVVVHHGLFGALAPQAVYDHPEAWRHPWAWAGVHAGFVLAASAIALVAWRLDERTREAAAKQARTAERAVRLQRATAALAEAVTAADVSTVLAAVGAGALGADASVVASASDGEREWRREVPPDLAAVVADAVRTGVAAYLGSRAELEARYPHLAGRADGGLFASWAVLPLVGSGGEVLGALVTAWTTPRRFGDEERVFLLTLAAQSAQALERARLFEAEHDIATTLQRALLPDALPTFDRVSVSARYVPAGTRARVGGDWYDVVGLPDGRMGVVMGDVAGHGVGAAAAMSAIRHAVRAYALEGHRPAAVVERTNRVLATGSAESLATCCYLELDPERRVMTVVRAGHLPPLVVEPGGRARFLATEGGLLLGVDAEAAYAETTVRIDPGATVVLYTDGVAESAALPLPEGLERLRASAARAATTEPAALVDHLLAATGTGAERSDDSALLALRCEHEAELSACRTLPADPASARSARRFVAEALAEWGCEEAVDAALLVASELVTNALTHGAGEVELRLRVRAGRLRVEVADEGDGLPERRTAADGATSGRGLRIVDAFADAWGVVRRDPGKVAWCELALRPSSSEPEPASAVAA